MTEFVSKTLQIAQPTLNALSRENAAIPNLKFAQVVSTTAYQNQFMIAMGAFALRTVNALRGAAKNPIKDAPPP